MNHPFRRRLRSVPCALCLSFGCLRVTPLSTCTAAECVCVCVCMWVSGGLWSETPLNYHLILKHDCLFVGVFVLSARFALVHNAAQMSGKNRDAEGDTFHCSTSSYLSFKTQQFFRLPPPTLLSVFSRLPSSNLGVTVPTPVWLSFTPSLHSTPPTSFKHRCPRRQCYSGLPQQLRPPLQKF